MAKRKPPLPKVFMSRGVLPQGYKSMVVVLKHPAAMSQDQWESAGRPNWLIEFVGPPMWGTLGRMWATTDDPAYLDLFVMTMPPDMAAYCLVGPATVDAPTMLIPDVGNVIDRADVAHAIISHRRGRCHGRACVYHDMTFTTRPVACEAAAVPFSFDWPPDGRQPPYTGADESAVPPDEIPDAPEPLDPAFTTDRDRL